MKLALTISLLCLALTACGTTSQRYSVSTENVQAIKSLKTAGIGIRPFSEPAGFSGLCRLFAPMKVADNLNHTQYIQKAFEDELKMAGAYATGPARVTIGGRVNRLEFSTLSNLTLGGHWKIDLTLDSSNGKRLDVAENYEFDAGYFGNDACRNTSDAYLRAVQDLVGKAVRSQSFAELLR